MNLFVKRRKNFEIRIDLKKELKKEFRIVKNAST